MIQLHADKIKINGPKVDGSYSITFEVGEYMQAEVAQLMLIPQNTTVKVCVEEDEQ